MPKQSAKRRYTYKSKISRRSKKARGIKKVIKLTLISILGLFLFTIAFYLYSITLIIKRPFAQASGTLDYNQESYDSTKPFNIVFVKIADTNDKYSNIESLFIYHIDTESNKAVLIELPVESSVEYSKRLGSGEIKKIYSLGNFGDENRGVETLISFIEKQFAINLDAYVVYDGNIASELETLGLKLEAENLPSSIKLFSFLKVPQLFDISRNQLISDLSSKEVLKIIGDTKVIQPEDFNYRLLSTESVTEASLFDNFWQESTVNSYVQNTRPTVSILNSTSTSGLASWGSRFVKNTGGVVLNVDNEDTSLSESIIYTDITDSEYLQYLVKYFRVEKVLPVQDYEDNPFLAKRSDYLIILGENNSLRL